MGNRAVITTNENLKELGVYLHWNGGRDSVEAFLAYCKMKKYASPERDGHGVVMLASVIANFFGSGRSCEVDVAEKLDCDNYDNGVYIVRDWLICGRLYNYGEQLEIPLKDFIKTIDNYQPGHMRLTPEEWAKFKNIEAEVIKAREVTE